MVKYKIIIPIIMAIAMLAGCTPQVKTVYQEVKVPVYVFTKTPDHPRPQLYISTMTEAQKNDIGELVKGYSISFKQVMQYACIMEKILDKYDALAAQEPTTTKSQVTLTPSEVQDCNTK